MSEDRSKPSPDYVSPQQYIRRHGSWLGRLIFRVFREHECPNPVPGYKIPVDAAIVVLRPRWWDIFRMILGGRLWVEFRISQGSKHTMGAKSVAYVAPPRWADRYGANPIYGLPSKVEPGSIPGHVFRLARIPILFYRGEWSAADKWFGGEKGTSFSDKSVETSDA